MVGREVKHVRPLNCVPCHGDLPTLTTVNPVATLESNRAKMCCLPVEKENRVFGK